MNFENKMDKLTLNSQQSREFQVRMGSFNSKVKPPFANFFPASISWILPEKNKRVLFILRLPYASRTVRLRTKRTKTVLD